MITRRRGAYARLYKIRKYKSLVLYTRIFGMARGAKTVSSARVQDCVIFTKIIFRVSRLSVGCSICTKKITFCKIWHPYSQIMSLFLHLKRSLHENTVNISRARRARSFGGARHDPSKNLQKIRELANEKGGQNLCQKFAGLDCSMKSYNYMKFLTCFGCRRESCVILVVLRHMAEFDS